MKKGIAISGVLLFCLGLGAYAVDLTSYGYQVLGTHHENELTFYDARDAAGVTFAVASAAPLTDANMQVLGLVLKTFEGWHNLKISRIRIVFSANNHAEILVLPSSFVYKGVDLSTYMPSGMQFQYTDYLSYDFRMYKDSLFLRVYGQLYNETEFADRLLAAVNNPVLYLQTTSPDYLLKQINDIVNKVESLTEKTEGLAKSVTDLKQQLAVISHGLVSLNNRGLFGTVFPIDAKTIDRVVELKRQNPSMTRDQLTAALQKEGVKISDNAIKIILGVYFDEF